jgi:hypothetical protein
MAIHITPVEGLHNGHGEVGWTSPTNLAAEEVIAAGREARARLARCDRFADWLAYGRAVEIGRARVERQVGKSVGQKFNKALGTWLRANHLDGVDKSTRSHLRQCLEREGEITTFLAGLDDAQRLQLGHPRSVLRAWLRYTGQLAPRPHPQKAPDAGNTLREVLTRSTLEELLEALPPALRDQITDRALGQADALGLQRTHDRELSRQLVRLLTLAREGKVRDVTDAAGNLSRRLVMLGREPQDLGVYLHRTAARRCKIAA